MSAIVEVKNLKKHFKTPRGMLHAVDGVDFSIRKGQTLGIVGESGCGKSTLGRVLLHLLEPTGGSIFFQGDDITSLERHRLKSIRKDMQMIFQDPYSSLNPRMTVSEIIAEPMQRYRLYKKQQIQAKVKELMETVGLAERLQTAYPHELDGGRRQRIGVARALALDPKFIVCDEPVSALDVSIQAQILNLMMNLQEEFGLTYMFITHDLSVVKHISDEIGVMYLGQLVEKCSSKNLFQLQYHPYTKALLSAIPRAKVNQSKKRVILRGEISSPIDPKPCCRFAQRCPYAEEVCFNEIPELNEVVQGHFVSCHLVRAINTDLEKGVN